MKKLEYWFKKNNIMINAVKTVEMSFHTKLNRFSLQDLKSLLEIRIWLTNQNQNFLVFILQKI